MRPYSREGNDKTKTETRVKMYDRKWGMKYGLDYCIIGMEFHAK